MPIVASSIDDIGTQADGRRWVRESHTDQVGAVYERHYLTGDADDINAALAAYATQLGSYLTEIEINSNIHQIQAEGSLAEVRFVYSTMVQNRAALRAAYQNSTRVEAIMIGDFLSSLTNAQLQTAFGMTAGQVTTLRANKLTPAADAAMAIRAATGA